MTRQEIAAGLNDVAVCVDDERVNNVVGKYLKGSKGLHLWGTLYQKMEDLMAH